MRLVALSAAALLTAGLATGVRADDARLEQEIKDLKVRLEALEKALAETKKAAEEKAAQQKPGAAGTAPGSSKSGTSSSGQTGFASKFQGSGYLESRFTNYANSRGDARENGAEFQLSRLRARLNFMPEEHWLVSLEVNAGTRSDRATQVDMREFYLQYIKNNRLVRVGQQRVPFGFQVGAESSRDRAALERARVFTVLFPNERDIGLILGINNHINNSEHDPKKPRYTFGVLNGEGINRSDANREKNVAGSVTIPLGRHEVGASFYLGNAEFNAFGNEVDDTTKRAFGFDHRFRLGRLQTQLEYLFGELFGANFHGGYFQVLYNTGAPGHVFVRADVFDPDTDASRDFWRRVSLGWYKDVSRNFRVTAQYDFLKAEGTNFDNTWGLEAQLRF